MKLTTNDIIEIKDKKQRFFVFKLLVGLLIKNNQIQRIITDKLNEQETTFLIDSSSNLLSEKQLRGIKMKYLPFRSLIIFINNFIDKLINDQLNSLDFGESEIMNILINKNCLPKININKLKLVNFEQIGKNETKKLIKFLSDIESLKILEPDQIQPISLDLIDVNLQPKFISVFAHALTKNQIKSINFAKFDYSQIIQIIKDLHSYDKLRLLKLRQIKPINLFLLNDIEAIRYIFSIHEFTKYFANNIFKICVDDSFHIVNYKKIDKSFLNEVIISLIQNIDDNQSKLIKLKVLENEIREIFLNSTKIIIPDVEIQAIDLDPLKSQILNNLVKTKYSLFSKIQVQNIEIYKLDHNSQIILFENRREDLTEKQIKGFDTKNITIANLLITYAFDQMTDDQINSIEINELDSSKRSQILNKDSNFFGQLNNKLIQKIDLLALKKENHIIYRDLVTFKSNYFSIEQFMIIDYLDDAFPRKIINLVSDLFVKRCLDDENKSNVNKFIDYLTNIESISPETITPSFQKMHHIPNEIIISITNSRINHGLFPLIPKNIKCFIPAINHMFEHPNDFQVSIQYILKNWSNNHKRAISKIINNLKATSFSDETVTLLLDSYLFNISKELIQSFDLSKVPLNIIEKSIINRPLDFLVSQISCIEFPKPFQINKFIELLTTNNLDSFYQSISLPNELFQLIDFNHINLQYLNCICRYQSNNIPIKIVQKNINSNTMNRIDKNDFFIFLRSHINHLLRHQIKKIKIYKLNIISILVSKRFKDLSSSQMEEISELDFEAFKIDLISIFRKFHRLHFLPYYWFDTISDNELEKNLKEILIEKLQERININKILRIKNQTILELPTTLQIRFINHFSNNLSPELFSFLNIKNIKMIEFLINNNLLDKLTVEQIQSIILNELNNKYLKKLIKSTSLANLSKDQIRNDCITKLLNTLNSTDLINILEKHIYNFKTEQIQSIVINDIRIAIYLLKTRPDDLTIYQICNIDGLNDEASALLILKRPNDASKTQIQKMNFRLHSPINRIIKKNNRISGLFIMRKVHRYKDLSEQQFNNDLQYTNTNVIEEILYEDLQNKITIANIHKIDLQAVLEAIDINLIEKLFITFSNDFSNEQIRSLKTEDKNTSHFIIKYKLFHKLTNEQKNHFNKNELLECDEFQLIFILTVPFKLQIDTIITGLLIYKYFSQNNNSYELEVIINNIIYTYKSDIVLAKFAFIIENEFQNLNKFNFQQISENFFRTMDQNDINIFKKLEQNEEILLKIGNILIITPDELVKIICYKCILMNETDARKIIGGKYKLFMNLPEEYKRPLLQLWVGKDEVENKFKVFSIQNSNDNQNQGLLSTIRNYLKKL